MDITEEFLQQKNIAVAGSFANRFKVAYRIVEKLAAEGHTVYPVTISICEVEGRKCYKSILDITEQVDALSLVTPPQATEKIVKDCLTKGIKFVWMQPGAESPEAIKFCRENGISVIFDTCVLNAH